MFRKEFQLKIFNIFFLIFFLSGIASAQYVKMLSSGTKTSIRGLSVVNDKVIWVSGSKGTVGISTDSGQTWRWTIIKGFENTEFRDIEAFDEKNALIMGITEPAVLLRTADGGKIWDITFIDSSRTFLDAMEFWNEKSGIVIGDPVNGRFFIARTFDGGKTWRNIPFDHKPVAENGEACFASSGTNIRKLNKKEAVFISGGMQSNFFYRNEKTALPLLKGKESTGANSLAVKNGKHMMVAGGDFNMKDFRDSSCTYTTDGGKTWLLPDSMPHGYRSCIEYIQEQQWVACGLNGVDLSTDDGKTFVWISRDGYHVCRKAKKGNSVFFAGGNGRIGKLIYQK